MKKQNILTAMMIAGLAASPALVFAKDGNDSATMDRAKTMTQERSMKRDQTAAHDALMERDRKRDQLKDGTGDQDQDRDRDRLQDGSGIYGSAMMNDDEIKQYREQIRTAKSEEERMKLMKQHRIEMQDRAREQGIELAGEE